MNNKANAPVVIPINSSYESSDITAEAVTIPAGIAGVVVDFYLNKKPILDSNGSYIGGFGNTSVSPTSTAFSTEVSATTKDEDMANGEYWINYVTGRGRGKKADNSTAMTADYSVATINIEVEAGDIEGDVEDGVADSGKPVGIGGLAKSSQKTAVDDGDRTKSVFNLFGEAVLAGYTWATKLLRVQETDPVSGHGLPNTWVNEDNLTATTHDYEFDMGIYSDVGIDFKLVDADGTVTLKVYVKNEDGDYDQVMAINNKNATAENVWTVASGTLTGKLSLNLCIFDKVKIEVVCSGATNSVYVGTKRKYR